MSSPQPVVILSPDQLAELVRNAVAEALAEQREDAPALLLDRSGIAKALGCSPSTINRLRQEGMPCVLLGDSPRFEADRCVEWLRTHRRVPQ